MPSQAHLGRLQVILKPANSYGRKLIFVPWAEGQTSLKTASPSLSRGSLSLEFIFNQDKCPKNRHGEVAKWVTASMQL